MLPTLTVDFAGNAIPEIEILFGLLLLPAPVGDVLAFEQERRANETAHTINVAKYFVFMV